MRTIRNVFDQYDQPENKLTHSLMSCLNEDRELLKNFLNTFRPKFIDNKKIKKICVNEQTLPEEQISDQEEIEVDEKKKGLSDGIFYDDGEGVPDGIIYDDKDRKCIIIESKIELKLSKKQLLRHEKSVSKRDYEIRGLYITVEEKKIPLENWKNIIWSDIYSWAYKQEQKIDSRWAGILVGYFDKLEEKMRMRKKGFMGSITKFTGINFKGGYSPSEGKHVLIHLMKKIRTHHYKELVTKLGADFTSNKKKPIKTLSLWDKIPLKSGNTTKENFHISISVTPEFATAGLTLPNQSFRGNIRKRFNSLKFQEFQELIYNITHNIVGHFRTKKNYIPHIRIRQRRYPSQNSTPIIDGKINFDIRTAFSKFADDLKPKQKPQIEWLQAAHNLMLNRKSNANMEFQIGVDFYYGKDSLIKNQDADEVFVKALVSCKPLLDKIAP